ncbi:MAG: 2-thiouracil desulfurase family protein [Archangium sp.]|nr:2-thiouracil desulfurase family protein [Archangium sp.]
MELSQRLADGRSRRVVFVSHCLLNENTRYLGGARRPGPVREVIDACLRSGVGMVQLPCPEQLAWGGVLKRRLLRLYGAAPASGAALAGRKALVPLALAWTRIRYTRLARRVVAQMADYARSGFEVVGAIGVDGSPSCGVQTSLAPACLAETAAVGTNALTVEKQNELVRRHARPGRGLFVEALERELARRGLSVRLLAHDLLTELDGRPTPFDLD